MKKNKTVRSLLTKNIMEEIRKLSDLVQATLYEVGAIVTTLIGLLGVFKLLKDQAKQFFGK